MLRGVGHDASTDSLPYASSLCGACYDVCPVATDIPEVLVHLRAQVVDAHRSGVPHGQDMGMKAAAWTLGSPARLGLAERLAGVAARVLTRSRRRFPGGRISIGRLPWPGSRWTDARDLPAPPTESFRRWWTRTNGGTQ